MSRRRRDPRIPHNEVGELLCGWAGCCAWEQLYRRNFTISLARRMHAGDVLAREVVNNNRRRLSIITIIQFWASQLAGTFYDFSTRAVQGPPTSTNIAQVT